MDYQEAKSKLQETIGQIKELKQTTSERQAELTDQKRSLGVELEKLQTELQELTDKKAKAEATMAEAEAKEVIEEMSRELATLDLQAGKINELVEQKAVRLQEITAEQDKIYVEGYEKRCAELKQKRNSYYQDMLDHIDALEADYDSLCAIRLAHKQMTDETSRASVKHGGEPIQTGSFGLTIRGNRGTIDRGWKNSFEAWINRVAELLDHGDKLVV